MCVFQRRHRWGDVIDEVSEKLRLLFEKKRSLNDFAKSLTVGVVVRGEPLEQRRARWRVSTVNVDSLVRRLCQAPVGSVDA